MQFIAKALRFSLLILIFAIASPKQSLSAQQSSLVGPILALARPIGGDILTFQDVGSNRVWQVKLPNSSVLPNSWSPDGCNLLVQGYEYRAIVSVPNGTLREIPQSSSTGDSGQSLGAMIWSFDGKSLTLTKDLSNDDVRIYSMSLDKFATNLILSLNESGGAIRWLSETELLYRISGGDYFVWDTVAGKSSLYRHKPQVPSDWLSDIYLSDESPNGAALARYYSVNALKSFVSASQEVPPPEDISPEYVSTLEAIPKVPGFDVYTIINDSTKHIAVMGQFLQYLEWSPSSDRIAVTTDPISTSEGLNGIYLYSLIDESLERIGVFPAMYNLEYGGYEPQWSPDSNWLSFNTPTGYVIYNLTTKKTINLSEAFDGFYMSVGWSPIMDYSKAECNS